MKGLIRNLLLVSAGLMAISAMTEGLEFAIVSIINAGVTTDPESYFATRNRPQILAAKLLYNFGIAALVGYFLALLQAGRSIYPAAALAAVQTLALVWGSFGTSFSRLTPTWMWVALIAGTGPAILLGAHAARRGKARG